MFISNRRALALVSFLFLAACSGAASEGVFDAPEGAPTEQGGAATTPPATTVPNDTTPPPKAEPADAGVPDAAADADAGHKPVIPPPTKDDATCLSCVEQADGEPGVLCDGSFGIFTAYLGCMCSAPCASECADTACALIPKEPSAKCVSCMELSNAQCGEEKKACTADE